MATNFPASLDSLTNPTSSDSLNSPSHSAQHANVNDAVEALQAKVGADSSAVTSSLDYKVAQLEAASTGKILQVVTATYSTEETTTSATASATSLTATITPTATTSDILIYLVVPWRATRTNAQYSGIGYHAIYRGATEILEQYLGQTANPGSSVTRWIHVIGPVVHLDSPATTSATTYTMYHRTASGQTLETFTNNYPGYMILMEVAA